MKQKKNPRETVVNKRKDREKNPSDGTDKRTEAVDIVYDARVFT